MDCKYSYTMNGMLAHTANDIGAETHLKYPCWYHQPVLDIKASSIYAMRDKAKAKTECAKNNEDNATSNNAITTIRKQAPF